MHDGASVTSGIPARMPPHINYHYPLLMLTGYGSPHRALLCVCVRMIKAFARAF